MNILTVLGSQTKEMSKKVQAHIPEILTGVGVLGFFGGSYKLTKDVPKLKEIKKYYNKKIAYIKAEELDEAEEKKAIQSEQMKEAKDLVKVVGPTAIIYAAATACTVSSTKLLRAEVNDAKETTKELASAYLTLQQMYKTYRNNIKETLGENADVNARFGLKDETVSIEKVDEATGKTKKEKEKVKVQDRPAILDGYSDYARIFDASTSSEFRKHDRGYNEWFIGMIEHELNILLNTNRNKTVFLNDAYDKFGFLKTRAGQVTGWCKDETLGKDNEIKINAVEVWNKEANDSFWILDFNVDGVIISDEYDDIMKEI